MKRMGNDDKCSVREDMVFKKTFIPRFILVRGLFTHCEMAKIKDCVEKSEDIKQHSYGREDSKGRLSKLCIWNLAGNDVLGMVVRSQKIAGTARDLMGGDEIYHYHSKVCCR